MLPYFFQSPTQGPSIQVTSLHPHIHGNTESSSDSVSVSRMSVLSLDSIVSGDGVSLDSHEVYVAASDIR